MRELVHIQGGQCGTTAAHAHAHAAQPQRAATTQHHHQQRGRQALFPSQHEPLSGLHQQFFIMMNGARAQPASQHARTHARTRCIESSVGWTHIRPTQHNENRRCSHGPAVAVSILPSLPCPPISVLTVRFLLCLHRQPDRFQVLGGHLRRAWHRPDRHLPR